MAVMKPVLIAFQQLADAQQIAEKLFVEVSNFVAVINENSDTAIQQEQLIKFRTALDVVKKRCLHLEMLLSTGIRDKLP